MRSTLRERLRIRRLDQDELARFGPSRLSVGKAAAVLFFICGALSLISPFSPLGRGSDSASMFALGGVAFAAGFACWFLPWNAWPRWATHLIVPVAFVLIALGIGYFGDFYFICGICFCAAFTLVGIAHPRGTGLAMLPWFAAACILPVYLRTGDLLLAVSYMFLVGVISIVVSEALAWFGARLRRSQLALWRAHAAVDEISADLASPDSQAPAWSAAAKLSQRFDVPQVDIYSLADSGALARLATVSDGEAGRGGWPAQRWDLLSWPAGAQAVHTKEPVNERTVLTMPLIARNRVVGLAEMRDTRKGRAFSTEKVAAIGPACRLIAVAVQDAEALRAEHALTQRLASMLASSRAVASADTLEEALAIITRCAGDVLGVTECVAYEYMAELEAIIPRAMWEMSPTGWDRLGDVLLLREYPAEAGVLARCQPLLELISDPDVDPTSRASMSEWGEKCCLTVPMLSADGPMGLLTFWDSERERIFLNDEMALATGLAELAGDCVRSTKLLRKLARLSTTDPLTGLANHRQIHESLVKEQARSARSGAPFSVVMLDIDGFKLLNDTHGHPCGDEALRYVAATLQNNVRATDVVGRYGGDEFVVILPETDPFAGGSFVENLRGAISETPFVTPEGDRIPIQMSFGIAGYPRDARSINELMVTADANLYVSKRQGGNVVTGAGSADHRGAQDGEHFGLLESMVTAVDNKDSYTRRHSDEVTTYALAIATALGLSDSTLGVVRAAGMLHDVGKIGIPDRILRKPGRLTDAEYAIVKGHPSIGESLIRAMPDLEEIHAAVISHHERFDGTGYPQRLAGNQIPLLGRILAVADSYSAMTTDRPYRKALTTEEAIAELHAGAGTQFDPAIVAAFVRCLRAPAGEFDRVLIGPA